MTKNGSKTNIGFGDNSEQCCTKSPVYKIVYNFLTKTWLVCNDCLELEFFKADIKEKERISK